VEPPICFWSTMGSKALRGDTSALATHRRCMNGKVATVAWKGRAPPLPLAPSINFLQLHVIIPFMVVRVVFSIIASYAA